MYTRDPDTSYKVTNIFNLNFMKSQVPCYASKQMQETYGGPGGRGNESGTCEHFEVVVIWSI